MGIGAFFSRLRAGLAGGGDSAAESRPDRGFLVFENTGEVIRAERLLRESGFDVEVKGPPPQLRTGCDMVVVFPLVLQGGIQEILKRERLEPLRVVADADALLEPVAIFRSRRWDHWLMVRAANMKITLDVRTRRIVNISGGGCPDVPWVAHRLCGRSLDEAPEPLSMGRTLCCYSLQKAFEEARRVLQCG